MNFQEKLSLSAERLIMNFQEKLTLSADRLIGSSQKCYFNQFMSICATTQQKLAESKKKIPEKSSVRSIIARKAGNALFNSEGHDSKIHHDIFKYYCQSIAYAPKDTDLLALGYSDRSVMLMHLHRYDEALIDINRALELTKDNEFKTKLLARKDKCTKSIIEKRLSDTAASLRRHRKQKNLASKLLNFKPSAQVSCAANCIGLAHNDEFGRHLIATRDIKPGEIVIAEEAQVAYPVFNEIYLVCSHCLQTAWNGIPCEECTYTMYCSEACKDAAFKEYHDVECPIVKYVHHIIRDTEGDGCDRMAGIRFLVMAIRKEGFENVLKDIQKYDRKGNLDAVLTDGKLQCDKFKSFYNLPAHEYKMYQESRNYESNSSQILYILLEYTDFFVSLMKETPLAREFSNDAYVLLKLKDALTRLKYVTSLNEYPFESSIWKEGRDFILPGEPLRCDKLKGIVIAPCSSLLNHSCLPNVTHLCVPKRKIIVFATSPIQKGEMLCYSYDQITVLEGNTGLRMKMLEKFHFTCKCKACVNYISLPVIPKLSREDSKKIKYQMEKLFPKSKKNSSLKNPFDKRQISEEGLRYYSKMSQLLYKNFNIYRSFVYSFTPCLAYIERLMSTLYEEVSAFPEDC